MTFPDARWHSIAFMWRRLINLAWYQKIFIRSSLNSWSRRLSFGYLSHGQATACVCSCGAHIWSVSIFKTQCLCILHLYMWQIDRGKGGYDTTGGFRSCNKSKYIMQKLIRSQKLKQQNRIHSCWWSVYLCCSISPFSPSLSPSPFSIHLPLFLACNPETHHAEQAGPIGCISPLQLPKIRQANAGAPRGEASCWWSSAAPAGALALDSSTFLCLFNIQSAVGSRVSHSL